MKKTYATPLRVLGGMQLTSEYIIARWFWITWPNAYPFTFLRIFVSNTFSNFILQNLPIEELKVMSLFVFRCEIGIIVQFRIVSSVCIFLCRVEHVWAISAQHGSLGSDIWQAPGTSRTMGYWGACVCTLENLQVHVYVYELVCVFPYACAACVKQFMKTSWD